MIQNPLFLRQFSVDDPQRALRKHVPRSALAVYKCIVARSDASVKSILPKCADFILCSKIPSFLRAESVHLLKKEKKPSCKFLTFFLQSDIIPCDGQRRSQAVPGRGGLGTPFSFLSVYYLFIFRAREDSAPGQEGTPWKKQSIFFWKRRVVRRKSFGAQLRTARFPERSSSPPP